MIEKFLQIANSILQILSNNYELIIAINIGIIILLLFIIVLLKVSELTDQDIIKYIFHNFLLMVVTLSQLFFLMLAVLTYWANYKTPYEPIVFSHHLTEYPYWVKANDKIYYIDGSRLIRVNVKGEDFKVFFEAEEPISEYIFSPDGQYVCVLTTKSLYLVDRRTAQSTLVDSLQNASSDESLKGSISSVEWSPDSQKFVYEVSRWSAYSSQDNFYIYIVDNKAKYAIQSPARRITSLYWGKDAQALFYLQYEAEDTQYSATPYTVNVFTIPLDTLKPKLVSSFPSEKSQVPIESLNIRDIQLFLDNKKYAFGKPSTFINMQSPLGVSLGIDKDDHLYYVGDKWFKKRLFHIHRRIMASEGDPRYQTPDLAITEIKWLADKPYVLMRHEDYGILIMDPKSKKIFQIIQTKGYGIGWYN